MKFYFTFYFKSIFDTEKSKAYKVSENQDDIVFRVYMQKHLDISAIYDLMSHLQLIWLNIPKLTNC